MVWLPHWPAIGLQTQIRLGLERIKNLLEVLGSPHLNLPPTIHVAGTNGKGSSVAFMKSIFEAAGFKVHRYISPHMSRFNERILLAGKEIEDDYLFSLLEECRIATEANNLEVSFFEGITVAAFLGFSRVEADILLLETGLGGRLDATNVIEKPIASVITPISYDHQAILGARLEEIAYEKACIIKSHCPCIASMQTEEVHNVIENYAEKMNSPVIRFESEFGVSIANTGELEYKSRKRNIITPPPSLPGYHQYINAATAIAAIDNCYDFPDDIFKLGIAKAKWWGRLTRITNGKIFNKLPKNFELWVDGAHNEAGAMAVSAWLLDQPKKETILIFGMTRNRDINKFLRYFKGLLTKIICVNIQSEPDSYKAKQIPELINDVELKSISACALNLNEAFQNILESTSPSKSRILIAGSLFLASDFFAENGY
jgi:dihydrofolate synthase/folylpolyglutamate synthase